MDDSLSTLRRHILRATRGEISHRHLRREVARAIEQFNGEFDEGDLVVTAAGVVLRLDHVNVDQEPNADRVFATGHRVGNAAPAIDITTADDVALVATAAQVRQRPELAFLGQLVAAQISALTGRGDTLVRVEGSHQRVTLIARHGVVQYSVGVSLIDTSDDTEVGHRRPARTLDHWGDADY